MNISFVETTTIAITKKTRDQLAKIGDHDATFEDIIKNLLNVRDLK